MGGANCPELVDFQRGFPHWYRHFANEDVFGEVGIFDTTGKVGASGHSRVRTLGDIASGASLAPTYLGLANTAAVVIA